MRDHPEPGSPWIPRTLRGILAAFSREMEQEAFSDLQFRLPAPSHGPGPYDVRFPTHGHAGPGLARPASIHPPGFGLGPRPRGLGHV